MLCAPLETGRFSQLSLDLSSLLPALFSFSLCSSGSGKALALKSLISVSFCSRLLMEPRRLSPLLGFHYSQDAVGNIFHGDSWVRRRSSRSRRRVYLRINGSSRTFSGSTSHGGMSVLPNSTCTVRMAIARTCGTRCRYFLMS